MYRTTQLARIVGRQGTIRLFARKPHYKDHLRPIWEALPDEYKNTGELERGDLLLIAGGPDVRHGFPYVYVEHGVGQSYKGLDSSGYSGGSGHDNCRLFICPNEGVASRWVERYPTTPAVVVGCPRLDFYHTVTPPAKTVAITFHWDCTLVPETRSAFPHYRKGLKQMVEQFRVQGWTVLGHSHPRYERVLKPVWIKLGVQFTDDPLAEAGVLVADNTSLMAEFIALGRPVIALNCPHYRKAIWHGERFWDWDVTYANTAEEAAAIQLDRLRKPEWQSYAYTDGRAAERASRAIISLLQRERH